MEGGATEAEDEPEEAEIIGDEVEGFGEGGSGGKWAMADGDVGEVGVGELGSDFVGGGDDEGEVIGGEGFSEAERVMNFEVVGDEEGGGGGWWGEE